MTSSNYYDADITVQSMCNNMVVNGTITQKDQEHTLHTYRHVFGESAIWKGWITANDLKNLLHCSFFYLYPEERSHVSDLASSLKNYQSIQSIIDPSRISQFIRRIWRQEAMFNFVYEEFLKLGQEVVVQTCTVPSLMAILNVTCHSANMIHLLFPRSL